MKSPQQAYNEMHAIASSFVADALEHPEIFVICLDVANVPVKYMHSGSIAARSRAAELHRNLARDAHGAPVVYIAESWYIDGSKGDADAARYVDHVARGVMPARDVPEQYRGEAIVFNIRTASGAQFIAACPINRATRTLEKVALVDVNAPPPGHAYMGRQVGGAVLPRDAN